MTSSCRPLALVALLFVVAATTACVDRSLLPGGGTTPTGPSTTQPPPPPPQAPPQAPPSNPTSSTDAEAALASATIWNSPKDIASWAKTTRITQITMRPSGDPNFGLHFVFDAQSYWPNYTPPGWDGPLQYTVWACIKKSGQWHCSGIIQFWRERYATGAPILHDFGKEWVYDGRWGAMEGYWPVTGEEMIFFVSAGDARGALGVTSVRERSNAVAIKLPAGDVGTFNF